MGENPWAFVLWDGLSRAPELSATISCCSHQCSEWGQARLTEAERVVVVQPAGAVPERGFEAVESRSGQKRRVWVCGATYPITSVYLMSYGSEQHRNEAYGRNSLDDNDSHFCAICVQIGDTLSLRSPDCYLKPPGCEPCPLGWAVRCENWDLWCFRLNPFNFPPGFADKERNSSFSGEDAGSALMHQSRHGPNSERREL